MGIVYAEDEEVPFRVPLNCFAAKADLAVYPDCACIEASVHLESGVWQLMGKLNVTRSHGGIQSTIKVFDARTGDAVRCKLNYSVLSLVRIDPPLLRLQPGGEATRARLTGGEVRLESVQSSVPGIVAELVPGEVNEFLVRMEGAPPDGPEEFHVELAYRHGTRRGSRLVPCLLPRGSRHGAARVLVVRKSGQRRTRRALGEHGLVPPLTVGRGTETVAVDVRCEPDGPQLIVDWDVVVDLVHVLKITDTRGQTLSVCLFDPSRGDA